jgi:hypothetical protein
MLQRLGAAAPAGGAVPLDPDPGGINLRRDEPVSAAPNGARINGSGEAGPAASIVERRVGAFDREPRQAPRAEIL